jgi:hypothetical protein
VDYLKRIYVLFIAVVALGAVTLAFPTPHTRFREALVHTFGCTIALQDGGAISQEWMDMQNSTKIVIDIQSTEEVVVTISNGTMVLYSANDTIHAFSGIFSSNSYIVSVKNPIWSGTGLSTDMTGSIEAYRFDRQTEWLPWWMS